MLYGVGVAVVWCDVGGGAEENLCPASSSSSSSGAGRRWNEEVCAPSDCTLAPADMHAVSNGGQYLQKATNSAFTLWKAFTL